MFRRALIFTSAFFLLCGGLLLWSTVHLSPAKRALYAKLFEESAALHSQHPLDREPIEQWRERVQKDLWLPRGTERLHMKIQSATSHLTLYARNGQVEATEQFEHLRAFCQEAIDPIRRTQEIRTLFARGGRYLYPAHQLEAQAIHFAFYSMNGIELSTAWEPPTPTLSGVAETLLFPLIGREGLPPLTLSGHVEIASLLPGQKQSIAQGDELLYLRPEKALVLTAYPPRRVLFWQEGVSLTAPEIVLHMEGERKVVGKGDLHFTLSGEEQHALEALFAKYL